MSSDNQLPNGVARDDARPLDTSYTRARTRCECGRRANDTNTGLCKRCEYVAHLQANVDAITKESDHAAPDA